MNETQNPLPDESLLELPEALQAHLYPRRGFRPATTPEPDLAAAVRLQELVAANEADLRETLANPSNSAFSAEALDYLDGNANAVGAGIVATGLRRRPFEDARPHLLLEFDAWRQLHGLAFAVRAWMTARTVQLWGNDRMEPSQRQFREADSGWFIEQRLSDKEVRPLFATLASSEEHEYDAARTAVAGIRNTPDRRFLAAYLFPEESHWVAEACKESDAVAWGSSVKALLLNSTVTADEFAALGITAISEHDIHRGLLAPLLDCLGADALPLLTDRLRDDPRSSYRSRILDAIAILPSDRAMAYLFDHYDEPLVLERITTACARFPVRALRTIAAVAPTAWPEHRVALTALVDAADDRAWKALGPEERTALETLRAQSRRKPVAPKRQLPAVLTDPPWRTAPVERKPTIVKGLEAPSTVRLSWAEGERERFETSAAEHAPNGRWNHRWDRRADQIEQFETRRGDAEFFAYAPMELAAPLLHRWNGRIDGYDEHRVGSWLQALLVRFELDVLDRWIAFISANPKYSRYLAPVLSLDAARLAAHWLVRVKTARAEATVWLDRHGDEAAALLIPDALGGKKKQRVAAEAALHHIAAQAGPEPVLEAAAAYGEAAGEAIRELLEAGPETPRQKVAEAGDWLDPALLPQVLLKDGDFGLPEESVPALASVLGAALDPKCEPWLTAVSEVCDPDSLRIFARALFEQWLSRGAPWSDHWVLSALAHFGDDETVARLTPLIKAWPGQNQHHRAVAGLRVLGGIGSEEALRAMQHISRRAKFKAIKAEAALQMRIIAEGLGLTTEQLADRLLPDFGLEADGSLVLDYGPRRFRVVFDEQLKPSVTDESGKPRKALPKPGVNDDAELAGAAYKRFAELKKELRTVSVDQVRRLESAMINARTWRREEFEQYLHGHPLMRHLTRRMIWLAQSGERRLGFRVAEDDTFSDAADEAVEVPEDAVIRLAHPIDMTSEERLAWAQVLVDYEILQPFAQLSRPVMAFTEDELATGRLPRFEGAIVPPGSILGLTKHGWVRGRPQDNGTEFGFHFPLPSGGFVAVELDPGLQIGMGADVEDQTLETVYLTDRLDEYYRGRDVYYRGRDIARAKEIDPVIASEVLAALDRLTAKE